MHPIDEAVRERVRQGLDENLAVVASAGTGKTTLLVDRVVAGVARGVYRPSGVVLVTFLKNACDELERRLAERLQAAAASAGGAERERLAAALAARSQFRITTLHALGHRLLTRYALEAQLAPDAEVWDAVETERQRQRCLAEWLAHVPPEHEPRLRELARHGFTFSQIQKLMPALRYVHPAALGASTPISAQALLDNFWERLVPLTERARQAAGAGDPARQVVEAIQADVERRRLYGAARSAGLVLSWKFPKTNVGQQANWRPHEAWLKEQKDELKRMAEELHTWQQDTLAQLMGSVCELAASFEQAFLAWRRERRGITFEDQQNLALSLLRDHPAVRREVAGSIATLLVDEFQDTAPAQVELVQWLAANPAEDRPDPDRPPAGRLVLMGDPKQSIYRFQGANLKNAMSWIDRLVASGAAQPVALTANFRSHPGVLAPVNELFGPLWADSEPGGEDPPYDELVPHRKDPAAARVFYEHLPRDTAQARRQAEADRVLEILRSARGRPWIDRSGSPRALEFEDMAVLLPNRSGFSQLALRLQAAHIPFHMASRDFYRRDDVRGLAAVLRAAVMPEDPVAVLAALRSVWLRVPDAELARHHQGGGQWHPESDGPSPSPAVAEAFGSLRDFGRLVRTDGVATLLERVARQREADLTQSEALNVRQLVRSAHEYERRWGYWEYADWLWQHVVNPSDADEAAAAEGVVVTTVHQAKGREWPLVVLTGFSAKGRRDDPVLVDTAGTAAVSRSKVHTPHWDALKAAADEAEAAEARRLWYVALTRARDYTVVVDAGPGYPLAEGLPRQAWPDAPAL